MKRAQPMGGVNHKQARLTDVAGAEWWHEMGLSARASCH
jgi:hypothetical protein